MAITDKLHIERNTIQETLVIPLFARKQCTELFPELFKDEGAVNLINHLDYDFSLLEKESKGLIQRFGALEVAMRQNDLAIEIKSYLKEHPGAAVVNMGCGLDQTGENCDNGVCKIYNLDMADVMSVRNSLIPAGERVVNIATDLNDVSWFDKIDDSDGAVFFAAGVFYYLNVPDVHSLINKMALRFKGGKIVFDTCNKTGLKMMLKTVIKQSGIENIGAFFHVDSMEKDVLPWLKNGTPSKKGYMLGYNDLKAPCIPGFFRILGKLGDRHINMQILRIDFNK